VPGGDANLFNKYNKAVLPPDKNDAPAADSTVIYSLMDVRAGFNPMQVHGAKRLILTNYSHHAGIEHGFMFGTTHLKGLAVLDLDPGIYIDEKQTPGKPNKLTGPVTDLTGVKDLLEAAKLEKNEDNKNRLARILEVATAFLKQAADNAVVPTQ
jgi:hypothetical protein